MLQPVMQKANSSQILVVDDTPSSMEILTDLLTYQGYRVRRASSGLMALGSVAIEPPDLILLDVKMPEIDGYEVCRRLKSDEQSSKIPVIFVSGLDEAQDKVKGFQAGGIDYITKPFDAAEVLARVETHLAMRHMQEQLENRNFQLQQEIAEHKRTQEALQTAHHLMQDIIEFLPDATFVVDWDKRVIAWNRAIEEMTGVKQRDILGKSDYTYALPFYGERRPMLIDLVINADPEVEKRYDFLERKGNTLYSEAFVPGAYSGKGAYIWGTATLLLDAGGNRIGAIETIRDITERNLTKKALQESEKKLRLLSSRLLNAQEEERERVARELHDSVGQLLAAIKYSVENVLDATGHGGKIEDIVRPLKRLIPAIQEAIEDARRIYMGLRPTILDDLGIIATIGWFCREFQEKYPSIRINGILEVDKDDIPEQLKIVIFRILQEALSNVAQYSKAEHVNILLLKRTNALEFTIEDNGIGFDLESARCLHSGCESGLGLSGMKERTELSEGIFTLESVMGEGSKISILWPIRPSEQSSGESV